ncbi:E3 ubiquitin-protein ligase MARCHF2-like [Kogia breviceps]|uniref:E3 ubiquitin-protein ligase MARCHF2-like n=1 Tax=Kogia breviceps TaxID=27615 RepID=UPI002795BAEF|nr:E3 ubiquitin-protein ligase MARCHF2-like [Kogia breviceps]
MRKRDCSGSPAFSMVLEVKSLSPPQYTQVTSRGVACSSQPASRPWTRQEMGPSTDLPRRSEGGELAVSAGCTGPLGPVHESCPERWLSSSTTSYWSSATRCLWRRSGPAPHRWFEGPRALHKGADALLRPSPLPALHGASYFRLHLRLQGRSSRLTLVLFTASDAAYSL